MAKPFRELSEPLDRDPVSRARIEEYKRVMLDVLALTALRESNGLRQGEAQEPATPPPCAAPLGPEYGIYLSTLESYVAELGGHLEVTAVFPDCRVPLVVGDGEATPGPH